MPDTCKSEIILQMRSVCDLSKDSLPRSHMRGPRGETRQQRAKRILDRQLWMASHALASLCLVSRWASPGNGPWAPACMNELRSAALRCRDGCRYCRPSESVKAFVATLEASYRQHVVRAGAPPAVNPEGGLEEIYPIIARLGVILSEPYTWNPTMDLPWFRLCHFRTVLFDIVHLMVAMKRDIPELKKEEHA